MDIIPSTTSADPVALPEPGVPVSIRVATLADLPFLDALQKRYGRALGYFPTKQFEGYIAAGHVLVAEGIEGFTRITWSARHPNESSTCATWSTHDARTIGSRPGRSDAGGPPPVASPPMRRLARHWRDAEVPRRLR